MVYTHIPIFGILLVKQRIISSILLFAFAIIFAHSIIPHHHEEDNLYSHHTSHEDEHNDVDDNFLGEVFAHFQHEQGNTIIYEISANDYQLSKINTDKHIFLVVQYVAEVLYKPPIKHPEPYSLLFTAQPFSITTLLRGPPVTVA